MSDNDSKKSDLEDPIPSVDECKAVYDKGYSIWRSLYETAIKDPTLPGTVFDFQDALRNQPYFPDPLILDSELEMKHTYGHLAVSGSSTWNTSTNPKEYGCDIPPLEKNIDIQISAESPTSLRLGLSTRLDSGSDFDAGRRHWAWFGTDENHIPVLFCAWGFIFSAKWAEIFPEGRVEYTSNRAECCRADECQEEDAVVVDICDVDADATRWW